MKLVQMTAERLEDIVSRFSDSRIAILGDFFLDKYLEVDPTLQEPSVETGKPAHQVVNVRCCPGAAGTVSCNLAALGVGQMHAIGFRGDDGEGYDLQKSLHDIGCDTKYLHVVGSRRTPTYLKPRDADQESLEAEHSRYDTKNRSKTNIDIETSVIGSLDMILAEVDAVIVLDQVEQADCGVVTTAVRKALSNRAKTNPNIVFFADSRRRIHDFTHLIVKPNEFETVRMENPLPEDRVDANDLRDAAKRLRSKNQAPVVITQGAKGMLVSDPDWTLVPGVAVEGRIDPTGAGDSATAGTVLSLCAGAELPEAALIGNLVASITIQQIATTGVANPAQLPERFSCWLMQHG